ncbi:Na+/H+ antiporter NhaA [Streptomyces sp. NPDC008141]|uniref:Na+/H+ antiporter NhaA n=1 Tax=Streptomyces sp. NPDC008141 TaxID=3364815 RepID=UPI0036EF61E2
MSDAPRQRPTFPGLLPLPERNAVADALRTETIGGVVLLAAAVVALIWANTPWSGVYEQIRDVRFGVPALGLDLSVGHWTADGLLAVFFLVAGVELKRELVVGELRTPATAALPVVAAICGMAVPAALYAATVTVGGGSLEGWAVPMATDIAFALAVLAVLAGIGFTVALLIGELAFTDPADAEHIKAAVLVGSLIASGLAALLVRRRNAIYRRLYEEETRDDDADGIPDIYQQTDSGHGGASTDS